MPCFSHTRNAYSCLNGLYRLKLDLLVPDLAEQKDSAILKEKILRNITKSYKEMNYHPVYVVCSSLSSVLHCSAAPFRAAVKIFLIFMGFFRKMPET